MLPALIALRLDDVAGENLNTYMVPMLDRGWKPNVGVFLKEMHEREPRIHTRLSSWARERLIDVSPHAFTANDFLFFDYPRGIPFSKIEFDAKWRQATTLFQQWGFPLSPVLNTHFHTLSACAQPILAEAGI